MLKNNEFFNKLMYKLGDYVIRQCDKNDIKEVIDINWKTLPEHYTEYFFIDILHLLLSWVPDRTNNINLLPNSAKAPHILTT